MIRRTLTLFVHSLRAFSTTFFLSVLIVASADNDFNLTDDASHQNHEDRTVHKKQSSEDVILSNQDEELVKLSSEIIQKLKCSTYPFQDVAGKIHVQIDDKCVSSKGLLYSFPMNISEEVSMESGGLPWQKKRINHYF